MAFHRPVVFPVPEVLFYLGELPAVLEVVPVVDPVEVAVAAAYLAEGKDHLEVLERDLTAESDTVVVFRPSVELESAKRAAC